MVLALHLEKPGAHDEELERDGSRGRKSWWVIFGARFHAHSSKPARSWAFLMAGASEWVGARWNWVIVPENSDVPVPISMRFTAPALVI